MNPNWKDFLLSEQAGFETETRISFPTIADQNNHCIYPLAHLAALTISGKDAATFLQGQITCNIHDLSDIKSSLGALCNPKGRAIATFLLIKTGNAFLMILPAELLQTVKKRLSLYILRSDVVLTDSSDELCLIGLTSQSSTECPAEALFSTSQQGMIAVNLGNRRLIVAPPESAITLWKERIRQGFQPANSAHWRYLDIISGLPWLTPETSEAFIPQMLNLDKLGGISFNKGCYTGQEVVARTHYLGKAKRAMFLAECSTPDTPAPNSVIIDDSLPSGAQTEAEQAAGRVLLAEHRDSSCKMLIVIPVSDTDTYQLRLADQHKLTLLTLNTTTV